MPDDLPPDELTLTKARELLANPAEIGDARAGQPDPESGNEIVAKNGRYGPYVTEALPEGAPKSAKARTGSLFASMSLETVSLDDAVKLLSLPRVVGADADGVEITAQNGRYGPYLKKGTDSRSLTSEEQLFSITLDEALAIYAQPKQPEACRRGPATQGAAALREVGVEPATEKPMVIKDEDGSATYVTDGETNASLRKGDEVDTITVERSAELLAERRARGPAPKRVTKKPAAPKKATTKAAATKATAAKKPAARATGATKTSTRTSTRTRAVVEKTDGAA